MEYVTLSNGVKMPQLGYGVYQVSPSECEQCVLNAIKTGYRLIDTAQAYYNEQQVGNAITKCGIPREELFIVTKIWISNAGYERAKTSIVESLRKLQTDYVDLLLIHQPVGDYMGTYRAMEEAYRSGKARAIGVSNFHDSRFIQLANSVEIKPMVNQIETHVFYQERRMQEIMKPFGTQLMSWGPFAEGRNNYFSKPVLKAVGGKYGKSVAQTALRFLIQRGVIVIPKSTHKNRMEENLNVFDFHLSAEDMEAIGKLDKGRSLFF